jgi:hypothetical protein
MLAMRATHACQTRKSEKGRGVGTYLESRDDGITPWHVRLKANVVVRVPSRQMPTWGGFLAHQPNADHLTCKIRVLLMTITTVVMLCTAPEKGMHAYLIQSAGYSK